MATVVLTAGKESSATAGRHVSAGGGVNGGMREKKKSNVLAAAEMPSNNFQPTENNTNDGVSTREVAGGGGELLDNASDRDRNFEEKEKEILVETTSLKRKSSEFCSHGNDSSLSGKVTSSYNHSVTKGKAHGLSAASGLSGGTSTTFCNLNFSSLSGSSSSSSAFSPASGNSRKADENGKCVKSLKMGNCYYCVANTLPIHSCYEVNNKIGKGTWGEVYSATERSSGLERAIKKLPKRYVTELFRFRQEIKLLKEMDHPNICRLFETFEDYANIYLVMEKCKGGELFDWLVDLRRFPEHVVAHLMKQILSSVLYCHRNHVAHRDLKPENFLFAEKDLTSPLKLVDFGLAKKFSRHRMFQTKVGTLYYVSPQVLEGEYDEYCDLWSAGVIMYVLLSGTPPFSGLTDNEIISKIRRGHVSFSSPIWHTISPFAKHLIQTLLTLDTTERLNIVQVLQHDWLQRFCPPSSGMLTRPFSLPCKLSDANTNNAFLEQQQQQQLFRNNSTPKCVTRTYDVDRDNNSKFHTQNSNNNSRDANYDSVHNNRVVVCECHNGHWCSENSQHQHERKCVGKVDQPTSHRSSSPTPKHEEREAGAAGVRTVKDAVNKNGSPLIVGGGRNIGALTPSAPSLSPVCSSVPHIPSDHSNSAGSCVTKANIKIENVEICWCDEGSQAVFNSGLLCLVPRSSHITVLKGPCKFAYALLADPPYSHGQQQRQRHSSTNADGYSDSDDHNSNAEQMEGAEGRGGGPAAVEEKVDCCDRKRTNPAVYTCVNRSNINNNDIDHLDGSHRDSSSNSNNVLLSLPYMSVGEQQAKKFWVLSDTMYRHEDFPLLPPQDIMAQCSNSSSSRSDAHSAVSPSSPVHLPAPVSVLPCYSTHPSLNVPPLPQAFTPPLPPTACLSHPPTQCLSPHSSHSSPRSSPHPQCLNINTEAKGCTGCEKTGTTDCNSNNTASTTPLSPLRGSCCCNYATHPPTRSPRGSPVSETHNHKQNAKCVHTPVVIAKDEKCAEKNSFEVHPPVLSATAASTAPSLGGVMEEEKNDFAVKNDEKSFLLTAIVPHVHADEHTVYPLDEFEFNLSKFVNLGEKLLDRWRRFSVHTELKKAALIVIAQQVGDKGELEVYRDLFVAFDTDSSGTLTYKQMFCGLASLLKLKTIFLRNIINTRKMMENNYTYYDCRVTDVYSPFDCELIPDSHRNAEGYADGKCCGDCTCTCYSSDSNNDGRNCSYDTHSGAATIINGKHEYCDVHQEEKITPAKNNGTGNNNNLSMSNSNNARTDCTDPYEIAVGLTSGTDATTSDIPSSSSPSSAAFLSASSCNSPSGVAFALDDAEIRPAVSFSSDWKQELNYRSNADNTNKRSNKTGKLFENSPTPKLVAKRTSADLSENFRGVHSCSCLLEGSMASRNLAVHPSKCDLHNNNNTCCVSGCPAACTLATPSVSTKQARARANSDGCYVIKTCNVNIEGLKQDVGNKFSNTKGEQKVEGTMDGDSFSSPRVHTDKKKNVQNDNAKGGDTSESHLCNDNSSNNYGNVNNSYENNNHHDEQHSLLHDISALYEENNIDTLLQLISEIDTNASHSLDYSEFLAACMDESMCLKEPLCKAAFRAFDKNGDGRIDATELKSTLGWHGFDDFNYQNEGAHVFWNANENNDHFHKSQLMDRRAAELIREADFDHDGYVNYEDFIAMLRAT